MARVEGVHDLGGSQGFGPVETEPNEPVFHESWEGRTFATVGSALGAGGFNTPMFRHAIERMRPAHYLASSYYEHWLTGATTLLVEAGVLTVEELEARAPGFLLSQPALVDADDVATGGARHEPAFAVGDRVRAREVHFGGHTRCPRYVFGKYGEVVAIGPLAPIPELEAHRNERVDQPTYAVRFDARELWGDAAEAGVAVHVDLYEQYLQRA
jgi:nitrile hydratase subunit beta